MQFALPENLKSQLVHYDPELKKQIKVRRESDPNAQKRKQSEFPIGKVEGLIPANIVSEAAQLDAVTHINRASIENKVNVFTKHVCVNPGAEKGEQVFQEKVIAVLYYYESVWHAAWLPQNDEVDEYLYGFSVAFKDGAKASEKVHKLGLNSPQLSDIDVQYVKFVNSNFRVYSHKVTVKDIENDKYTTECWNLGRTVSYYKKCVNIISVIRRFKSQYLESIPTWEDSYETYDRINPKNNNIGAILRSTCGTFYNIPDVNFYPTVESMLSIIDPDVSYTNPENSWKNYVKDAEACKAMNTPFFRSWVQSKCNQIVDTYNDKSNNKRKKIGQGFRQFTRLADWMSAIYSVWPDTPIDLFRTHIDALLCVPPVIKKVLSNDSRFNANLWLRERMPVASFFKILDTAHKKHEQKIEESVAKVGMQVAKSNFFNEDLGVYSLGSYNEIADTFSMLSTVISKQMQNNDPIIEPPSRWRIMEFHDHVQAESWKIQNENIDLPQDLFPQPIKVVLEGQNWTFFQPINTHQLAAWGQAVRNCVGSHSNYAEGVKKKQHFIVLGMLDSKPRFTIQLRVNNGMMNVTQIKDVYNSSLKSEEQSNYERAFAAALKKRSEELPSVTNNAKDEQEVVY